MRSASSTPSIDDVAAIHCDVELLGPEPLGDGTASGRDEQDVNGELLRFSRGAVAGRHLDLDAFCAGLRGGDLRACVYLDAAALEGLLELGRDRLILAGHEPREQLDHRHFAAETLED
jgi:hypothetical protein